MENEPVDIINLELLAENAKMLRFHSGEEFPSLYEEAAYIVALVNAFPAIARELEASRTLVGAIRSQEGEDSYKESWKCVESALRQYDNAMQE